MATIAEVLAYADAVRPNAFNEDVKVKWLNEVDGMIQSNIMKFAPQDCVKHQWTHREKSVGNKVFFTNSIRVTKKTGLRVGETVTITGCTITPANNKTAVVDSVSDDRFVVFFPENTFTPSVESAEILFASDRSQDETVAKFPHDKLYGEYLCFRICEAEGEVAKANNDIQRFQDFYDEFSKWFIRNYNPSGRV